MGVAAGFGATRRRRGGRSRSGRVVGAAAGARLVVSAPMRTAAPPAPRQPRPRRAWQSTMLPLTSSRALSVLAARRGQPKRDLLADLVDAALRAAPELGDDDTAALGG